MSKRTLALAAVCAALALPACRITPDEVARIETENELLREQIHSMRLECEQYRTIDIGVEKPGEEQDEAAPSPP